MSCPCSFHSLIIIIVIVIGIGCDKASSGLMSGEVSGGSRSTLYLQTPQVSRDPPSYQGPGGTPLTLGYPSCLAMSDHCVCV